MGLASEIERQEFESMCEIHPEVEEARTAFELALEGQLLSDAVAVPAHLKQAITERLDGASTDTDITEQEETQAPVRSIGVWKWLAAASIVLLAGTVYWAVTTNNKYQTLRAANQDLQNQLQDATAHLDTMKSYADILQKPGVRMAAMHGTSNPAMYATVYWDTATKDVYLMINNLPQPASDKQYQLWALLNNQPIDLGMIEVKQERLLYRMKNVRDAQAFAITLEPKGGSPKPTSSPMVLSRL
jgi:anti-sigma-K factor RskA